MSCMGPSVITDSRFTSVCHLLLVVALSKRVGKEQMRESSGERSTKEAISGGGTKKAGRVTSRRSIFCKE